MTPMPIFQTREDPMAHQFVVLKIKLLVNEALSILVAIK
jgi:hypothetical protein